MIFFHAIIIGIIQGLTEFIPVSSSGHLIIAHNFLGAGEFDLATDAVIQMGTILAVLIYFWKDLWKIFLDFFRIIFGIVVEAKDKIMVWAIILGSVPAVVFGLLLQNSMETIFRNVHLVAYALIVGSVLMYFADRFAQGETLQKQGLTLRKGIVVGFYQCLALIPGVSRSGATISGGLFQGFSREEATRFSFLLAFPIIVGSGLKEFYGLTKTGLAFTTPLLLSTIVAFVVGLWAISFLLKYLKNHSLKIFVWYRLFVAIVILIFL